MKAAAGDKRKQTAADTSSGLPNLFAGILGTANLKTSAL